MHPSQGGPPVVVAGHAAVLHEMGHQVTVITTTLKDQAAETVDAWPQLEGIELLQFVRDKPHAIGASRSLKNFLARNIGKYDVAHLHGVWELCLTHVGRFAKRHSVPYVLAPHGMFDRYNMRRSRTKKWLARHLLGAQTMFKDVATVQFGSEDERDEAEHLGISWPTCVIRNGVPEDIFDERASTFDVEELFPVLRGADPLLVFFSRMHYKKGIDILLEAFDSIANEFPNAKCLIAALAQQSDYEARIRERAMQGDLANSIVVTTELTGPKGHGVLRAADIFVLPSRQEGFSMAILEAMANRLPVLITDQCHMDFVAEIDAGVVTCDTIESVADGLRNLLSRTEQQRQEQGARGSQWVRENCTWKAIGKQLEATYFSLTKKAGPKDVSAV